jgi:hypothetical protein
MATLALQVSTQNINNLKKQEQLKINKVNNQF